MRKLRFVSVFVLLALLLSAGTGMVIADESTPPKSVVTQDDISVDPAGEEAARTSAATASEIGIPVAGYGEPLVRDAKVYASDWGISLDEALRRLKLQDTAGNLDVKLTAKERDTFAGLLIQHVPQFHIVVRFTRDGEETIRSYIEEGPLVDIVEVQTASVTLAELEAAQEIARRTVHQLGIPVNSGINVFENRVELYVTDQARLDTALREAKREANIQLPANVEIVTVDELSTSELGIFAGLALSQCTSGFSVKNAGGTKGIVTAAHCSNSLSYNGSNLPFQGSVYGGLYDVQWHTAPGFAVKNLMYDGRRSRHVYSTKHRNNQALNSLVCKYGKASGYTCGYIIDKNFDPGAAHDPTFIRVHRDGVDLSSGGDSGGPWFLGSTAYGVHTGGIGDDSYYMAINYVSRLGLTVLTN